MKKIFFLLFLFLVSWNKEPKNYLQRLKLEEKVKSTEETIDKVVTNDLRKIKLKGKVKVLTETSYERFGKDREITEQDSKYDKEITIYDEKGNEISKELYSYYLKRYEFVSKFEYDKKGRKIVWKSYDNYGDLKYGGDHFRYITKFSYAEKGNLIEEKRCKRYYSDNDPCVGERFYVDVDGNKIEGYKNEGYVVLTDLLKYGYDENGNKIEEKRFYPSGKLKSVNNYVYDKRGNLIEEKSSYGDGKLDYINKYVYDKKDNQIESKLYYRDDKLIEVLKSTYDEKGNMIESKANSIYWENKYQNGDEYAGGYKYEHKFEYQYDEKGNWIAQIKRGNQWAEYRVRYIEYYD
jgi:hypothetical protein